MFRDRIKDLLPADNNTAKLSRRQITDIFYTGLVEGAKWCGEAANEEYLNDRVRQIFEEAEDFAYEKFRRQAASMIERYGLCEGRQRLRAIAMDCQWCVDQASQYFGVDLKKFDSLDEMVNLTRALRNRGIEFQVEVRDLKDGANKMSNELGVVVADVKPLDTNDLSRQFGGAPVCDKRTTVGKDEAYNSAERSGPRDLAEQASPDPRETELVGQVNSDCPTLQDVRRAAIRTLDMLRKIPG